MGRRTRWIFLSLLLLAGCSSQAAAALAPDFNLIDQAGSPMALEDLRGRVVLLTFLYTYCTDTCPLYLHKIKQALSDLGKPDEEIAVVVVTVDPERDTVTHLSEFAASWPDNWHFLSGEPAQVARVWSRYDVYVEKDLGAGHASPHDYTVVHSAKLFVIDKAGYVAQELIRDWRPEPLVIALRQLVAEDRTVQAPRLVSLLAGLLQRCGEFATTYPLLFASLVLVIMLPGILFPLYLLRALLVTTRRV